MSDFTLEQLRAINAAIASGQLIVHYADKRVEYRSIADLIAARNLIRGELIAAGLLSSGAVGGVNRGPHTLAIHSRD